MDSSKVSLSLCGENVLFIGSSIAHHCNFTTLRNATGAHITTRKAYGTVFDENMFFPHSNLTDVVELEVADRKPAVLVLQSSSVDITVLKEKRLSYNEMAKAAKKSSTDIFTLAVKMSAYPFLKRIIVSERTPRIDSLLNMHLTEVANEELYSLYTRAAPHQRAKIHIGTHSLDCGTSTEKIALFGTPSGFSSRYDGWHLYGLDGPRLYTASVLNILSKAGITLVSSSPSVGDNVHPLDSVVKSSGQLPRLRGGGLPSNSTGTTPLEAGCICIFECKESSSECMDCDYCYETMIGIHQSPPS